MIHEIAVALAENLRSRGLGIPVVDGPEPTETTTFGRERVVLEYSEDDGDTFGPPVPHQNPRAVFERFIGVRLRIYTQSVHANALQFEHFVKGDRLVDMVLSGLDRVIRSRRYQWTVGRGRYTRPADLDGSPVLGGVVYELIFSVQRSVREVDWDGSANPELSVTGDLINSKTMVSLGDDNGTPPPTAEMSCGS
jgi:hypothetical protein